MLLPLIVSCPPPRAHRGHDEAAAAVGGLRRNRINPVKPERSIGVRDLPTCARPRLPGGAAQAKLQHPIRGARIGLGGEARTLARLQAAEVQKERRPLAGREDHRPQLHRILEKAPVRGDLKEGALPLQGDPQDR
jgi:hypothetical protein